jgi:hypothetical protein
MGVMEEKNPEPERSSGINGDVIALVLFAVVGIPVAYYLMLRLFAAFVPGRFE